MERKKSIRPSAVYWPVPVADAVCSPYEAVGMVLWACLSKTDVLGLGLV